MRRFAAVAVLSLVLVALIAPGVSARHGHNQTTHHAQTAAFKVKTNHAHQGGMFRVKAKVKHATHGAAFSASAVVHFVSGDVTVALKRHGKSYVAAAAVPVADSETPGAVPVDVTFTYDGQDEVVATEGDVQGVDEDTDDDGTTDEDTEDPSADEDTDDDSTTDEDTDDDSTTEDTEDPSADEDTNDDSTTDEDTDDGSSDETDNGDDQGENDD